MLNPQRFSHRRERTREELFTERYDGLLAWAMRLTNQDRAGAEDLVQDAFIQFVLGRTSIEEIENIDGYLRRMLRYMHLSRISRQAQKRLDQVLSTTDYDSFHQSWLAIEPSRRMQAQEELWQICSYACSRKETSRAGAVLILRFFHEYYPTEIARVLCISRHCVDQWQRLARSELKLYVSGPRGLRFLNSKAAQEPGHIKLSHCNGDLIGELRRMIFRSRQGECLPTEQLREIYLSGNDDALTVTKLGHIVSCHGCLDAVNQLLDLPLLAERYRGESGRPDKPPNDKTPGGSGGSGPTNENTKYQQRLREVAEHKPKELRIFVNGSSVGSLRVSSDLSELDLSLAHERKVQFVEIFSEQDVQLLFFSVNPEASPESDQWATIMLSEGRQLKAYLRFESDPALHIIYQEAALEPAEIRTALTLVKEDATSSLLVSRDSKPGEQGLATRLGLDDTTGRSRLNRLRGALKLSSPATTPRDAGSPSETIEKYESNEVTILGWFSPTTLKPFWARPGWLTALVSVIAVGAFLWLRTSIAPTPSATSLLEEASAAEQMSGPTPDQVTHQFIQLEVHTVPDGALVSRRKIEIWKNSSRSKRAQRLYDESDRLIAGAWLAPDGSQTIYHHRSGSRVNQAGEQRDNLLLNLDDIWQLDLSAREFRALVGRTEGARVIERPASYVITYDIERAVGASRLLKATLTLNRTDLHVVEQTLLVQRGGEVREYRFVEKSIERLPQKDVAPAVFEPGRELVGRHKATGRKREATIIPISPLPPVSSSLTVASAELEVDVAYLLNQAKADRHEQLSLARTADGKLRVEGVVDTEERRAELLRALAPISYNPAVKIELDTITGAMQRRSIRSTGRVTSREMEETGNKVAVDDELRRYLSTMGTPAADLDEAVRLFSSRNVNRSYRALFHAIELKRLVIRFANVDMRTITVDARTKWLQMMREHAIAVERETGGLRQEIQPIFFPRPSSPGDADGFEIAGDADLARAVEQLHKLALANNEAIRAAFTISSRSSSAELKSTPFWRSLIIAEKLAARIKHCCR